MQAGRVTTKNSCARNLSRLLSGVAFISGLLQRLAADPAVSLRCAMAQQASLAGGFRVQGFIPNQPGAGYN